MSVSEVYDKVESVLKNNKVARNSDKVLVWLIWKKEASESFDKSLDKLDSFEVCELTADSSICRVRRKIQNEEGRLQSRKSVEELRKQKKEELTDWAVGN